MDPWRRSAHIVVIYLMTLDQLLDYALSKHEVEESLPFGPDVLVLKTNGKMFLLIPLEADPLRFNA